jgi:hypothetical protein
MSAELREVAARMKALQAEKESLEKLLADVNIELDDIRVRKIPTMMESLGLKNVTFEGLGRVQLASDLYLSTKEGKKEEAMQWLRDMGHQGMITESYNASSMKALVRRLLVDGAEVPDHLFKITPFTRASIVKAN